MDVLICAAGSGSRLAKYTHDIIPKFLINIDDHTGIYYLINYWNKYADRIYLVINSSFNLITKFYINTILKEIATKIIIINYDSCDGTAYTLNHILNYDLKNYSYYEVLAQSCTHINVVTNKICSRSIASNVLESFCLSIMPLGMVRPQDLINVTGNPVPC